MLIKVNVLPQGETLPYDLYRINGELVVESGQPILPEVRKGLSHGSLYRDSHNLPGSDHINHEGQFFYFQAALSQAERLELLEEASRPSIIQAESAHYFSGAIGQFLERLGRGATPDIALCEVARDKLISEVTDTVDQIQYLSQIRIRDDFTYSHILDVTVLSITLAMKAGFSPKEVQEIALAAILHDLGKLLIPKNIMFKPSRLSEKEFQVMQLHPGMGHKMIVDVLKLPEAIARPALEHQEMYGGGGYPQNLKGQEIHPYSHVVKIADVYDALTSKRPYKESIPSSKALQIMLSEGEKSFHPELLNQFSKLSNYHDFSQEKVLLHRELAS